jgi:hypothetical protein
MGLLARFLPSSLVEALECEIDGLKTRRQALLGQRQAAEAALAKSRAERRARLLESDLDALGNDREKLKSIVPRLADELESVCDAIGVVEGKLAECEARLSAEREARARETERALRQEQLDAARAVTAEFKEAAARAVDVLAALSSVGPACAAARANLQYVVGELEKGFECAFVETTSYLATVVSGSTEIKVEPVAPQALPAPPPAKVERRTVVCLRPSKWQEPDGEIVTTGRLTQASVPLLVAQRALDLGHAIDVDSLEYQKLREIECGDFAWQDPKNCQWLDEPRPAPKPPESHATVPLQHSLAGARTGVATVMPPLR